MNRKCDACKLQCGVAVGGVGKSQPLGIVVSDYPGQLEIKTNTSLARDKRYQPGKFYRDMNAGSFIRNLLDVITKGKSEDFYYSNVIKCPPKNASSSLLNQSLIVCTQTWLDQELDALPNVPILAAGSYACKHLTGHPIYAARGLPWTYRGHTVIATYNPVIGGASLTFDRGQMLKALPGSPFDSFIKDVKDFHKECKKWQRNNSKET